MTMCRGRDRSAGVDAKKLSCRQNVYARPATRTLINGERGLENLFEQIALENAGWGSDAQALAFLQQDDLVGVFAGEVEFVGNDNDGIAILGGQTAKGDQQIDLRADVQVQRGFIEEEEERLLRESAGENDALLFAAGDFAHPAIAEMFGADLGEGVASDNDVVFVFEAQRAAVGMAALKDEFPGAGRKQQRAFLLHHGDALSTGARRERVGDETVQQDAA